MDISQECGNSGVGLKEYERIIKVELEKSKTITVCSACLTASCWNGIFYCEDSIKAGTVEKTIEELKELNLEHHDYWKD